MCAELAVLVWTRTQAPDTTRLARALEEDPAQNAAPALDTATVHRTREKFPAPLFLVVPSARLVQMTHGEPSVQQVALTVQVVPSAELVGH